MSRDAESPAIAVPEPIPQLLRDLVHERIGIYFETDRFQTLLEKLQARAAATGCQSFLDYYYLLKYDEKGPAEWRRVMDAFSVQETYFWRELDQVHALADDVAPTWFREHPLRPLRIWSAACASGEEPYSLAIALCEAGFSRHPIEIVASDASEAALEKARQGVYRERSFRALPLELRQKYFREVPGGFQLDRAIMDRVSFRHANLVAPQEIAAFATSTVIFCRNVFIYFSPASIARTVAVFARHMAPGGYLFVGASESLLKVTDDYELQELGNAFVYRRKSPSHP
jgi:chemotaxis protein methyltransferase CheR